MQCCLLENFASVPNLWCKEQCRFCSSEGDDKSFEPLPTQRSCSYKVRVEDIGRCLKCECIVTDVFGRSSDLAYAETAPVVPGYLHFKFNHLGQYLSFDY